MTRVRSLALAISLALCGSGTAFAASGVYTSAQATKGAQDYSMNCSVCHGGNLAGGAGPALKGRIFRQMAQAQALTAHSLLAVIERLMPQTAPGSLSPTEYADITAYILKENGYSAGAQELSKDSAGARTLKLAH